AAAVNFALQHVVPFVVDRAGYGQVRMHTAAVGFGVDVHGCIARNRHIDPAARGLKTAFARDLRQTRSDRASGSRGLNLSFNILDGNTAPAGLSDHVAFMLVNLDRTARSFDRYFSLAVRDVDRPTGSVPIN